MSSIANLGAASAALPQFNIHPHGHKKGLDALSTDLSSSDSTAQLPVPAAKNLFSNLLQSLEQVIGLKSTPASPAVAAAPAAKVVAGAAPATGITAAASTAAAAASTSAATGNTLLQNYLHNAPQNVQAAAAKLRFNA